MRYDRSIVKESKEHPKLFKKFIRDKFIEKDRMFILRSLEIIVIDAEEAM